MRFPSWLKGRRPSEPVVLPSRSGEQNSHGLIGRDVQGRPGRLFILSLGYAYS